jgi:hypothetical protein
VLDGVVEGEGAERVVLYHEKVTDGDIEASPSHRPGKVTEGRSKG